jgi:lipopolysaccharide export system permease protein
MKKIDKLVLRSFIGPFILTFLVVVFILLMQHMLKYFDDIIGKGLGWDVVGQLLFYFAIFMTPVALPLAVLLSALITFGNLGEHFELTAIKGSGISLLRILQPIFLFVILLTGVAFYANNYLVPKAALEAYSLLYDIKQKKPALDLREGTFYNGIPDISIKVNKKFPKDQAALKDIIVYDHRRNDGNREVIVADSGRMTTILNQRYLKFELFNGYDYTEGASDEREITGQRGGKTESLSRSKFSKTEVVFDLSSYDLKRTDKKWFEGNRIMRNLKELDHDIDSINGQIMQQRLNHYTYKPTYFMYYTRYDSMQMPENILAFKNIQDSVRRLKYLGKRADSSSIHPLTEAESVVRRPEPTGDRSPGSSDLARKQAEKKKQLPKLTTTAVASNTVKTWSDKQKAKVDSLFALEPITSVVQSATNMARQVKSQLENGNTSVDTYRKELATFEIQWHKILASSLACVAMFLIGAPLGAIIKRGGLGVPFLVSIFFFIVYYLLSMQGEKLAKQETTSALVGVWAADMILFLVGTFFLRQARIDARLFEADFYRVVIDKVRRWVSSRRQPAPSGA